MGKAATLVGRVGDVMIPNVVYDEHSRNTFLFKNCFLAQHVAPYLLYGTVFDNQKAVTVRGTFLNADGTLVQAVTTDGPGFWVLTPLQTADGTTVLVNRGFVPPDRRDPAARRDGAPQGVVSVTGLLRMSEPKGGFLRNNERFGRPLVFARRRRGILVGDPRGPTYWDLGKSVEDAPDDGALRHRILDD